MSKIKITKEIPVVDNVKPVVGKVYEVVGTNGKKRSGECLLFIEVNNTEVGVYKDRECVVVED